MTPEERAVIEAAEVWTSLRRGEDFREANAAMQQAVQALRASRQPKPRWRITGSNTIGDRDSKTVITIEPFDFAAGYRPLTDIICRLLNEDEAKP